ncbi:AEC family transporter [Pseudooceanicola nanhaiensis]|uniref:AEC family transporter n=1 Tax=Pseudooceanicola nanhaiensis TaxID=375761 RepID=UPI001CD734E3|nr:AEC family transporter [Pseudooceanicola nanhaiensis]MCA0921832.1 AEC family transporter [Pseudooceanicola nanhaiensis]
MNLVLTVLQTVAPVFLLAAFGYVWVKSGHEYRINFVTKLTMTVSVPCLIFVALMETEIDPAALTALSLASVVLYAVLTLAAAGAVYVLKLPQRTWLAPLVFSNTGNVGLPIALFAFGQAGLGYAVVVFAVMAIWSFTFGIWVVSGGGKPWHAAKEPLLWGTVLGGIFLWQGWTLPEFMTNTLRLTGQMAIPLMLITLGVALARLTTKGMTRAVVMAIAKYILCFAVAWVTGRAFGLNDVAFACLVLQAAMPVAVTSYMLAEKYGADSESVAALVVASTLLSVIALPLILAAVI